MNKISITFFCILLIFNTSISYGKQDTKESLNLKINNLLTQYIKQHTDDEKVTGIAVGIGYRDGQIINYFAGKKSNKPNAPSINRNDLFELGSITKSYVSVILLKLEAEGLLSIDQNLGDWLPQYPKWRSIKIKQLLNMTSGIPGYATTPELTEILTKNIKRQWTNEELIKLVYDSPIKRRGYDYSDTNYLIAGVIIKKATHASFENQLKKRLLIPFKLRDTYYSVTAFDNTILPRLVSGYYFGHDVGNLKTGEDVTEANLSVAAEAGAMISTSTDLVRWIQLVFSNRLLPKKQQDKLTALISTKTGQAISKTSSRNPGAFALGLKQGYSPEMGIFWYYDADTFGHRVLYLRTPCKDLIIALMLNSAEFVDTTVRDDAANLLFSLYKEVISAYPKYKCVSRKK